MNSASPYLFLFLWSTWMNIVTRVKRISAQRYFDPENWSENFCGFATIATRFFLFSFATLPCRVSVCVCVGTNAGRKTFSLIRDNQYHTYGGCRRCELGGSHDGRPLLISICTCYVDDDAVEKSLQSLAVFVSFFLFLSLRYDSRIVIIVVA